MKKTFAFLIILLISAACSVIHKSKQTLFTFTVIDKSTHSPIDSAKVILTAVIDSRDIIEYIKYTDVAGVCKFPVVNNPLAQYQARSLKTGYIGYYDESYSDLDRSISFINEETGKNIKLYLTSDTSNHTKFWASHSTRYDIDTLIHLLQSNRYPLRSEFPLLKWEDIPELLKIGNEITLIDKYPVNLLSSSYIKECPLGIVALWFVESARITELKRTFNPNDRFPSLTPSLYQKEDSKMKSNSVELMDQAYQAYISWWNEIKSIDKENGCKVNPLKNTSLEWK